MFDEWMHRNGLSLTTAAEALGLSRRMVSYYRTAQKPIPRQT
jgi:predicted transcriptional regulator